MPAVRWISALVCAVSAVTAGGTAQETQAATLTVCASGCPYTQIQPALNAAASGEAITVGPGTYAGGLSITKDVSVAGESMTATAIAGGDPG